MPLNLLSSTAAASAGLPSSYSSTFTPLSQCSTWLPVTSDARMVPLADRPRRVRRSGLDVVERRGLPLSARHLGVLVPLVVDDLILVADSGVTVFGDEVLQPAVAAGADLPLEIEIERVELVARHDIPLAERVRSVVVRDAERAVADPPTGAGGVRLLVAAPTAERSAVEQQSPPAARSAAVNVFAGVSAAATTADAAIMARQPIDKRGVS